MPSTTSPSKAPKNIETQLHYLADLPIYQHTKPLQVTPNFLDTEKRTNVVLSSGPFETIHDIRGASSNDFDLDENGFKFVKHPTTFSDWTSQDKIATTYLSEVEVLLRKEVEGVDEIVFFDARMRHSDDSGARVDGLSYNPFARQVHVDQTESSIITKIRSLTEMKADFLLRGRSRIINVWRPVRHPVYDCGLAVADGSCLEEGDVIECDRVRRDTGKYWDTMGVVKYREGFRWYYMSEQEQEDAIIFKNYDSDKRVKCRHCLHTAFDIPNPPPNAPPRQSVEVRALIFTYPSPSIPASLSPSSTSNNTSETPYPSSEILRKSTLAPLASALRPYGVSGPGTSSIDLYGNSDLLPESFHVPEGGVTVADVALLETEISRLRGLLAAQTGHTRALEEELIEERQMRNMLEARMDR